VLTHTVLFRLHRPIEPGARERLLDALRAFAADPPNADGPAVVAEDLRLREEGNPRVADVLMRASFPDRDAFDRYLADPRHVALVRDVLTPTCESWLSVQDQG
jgi:Stress responsive A/B Barrel Domain